MCVSDFCHDDLWYHENATFSKPERSEVTTSLLTFLSENKISWKGNPRGSAEIETSTPEEIDESTQIDSCGACSSCKPDQLAFFHVGEGLFKPVPNHNFSEILDLTPLDLSDRGEREWAMNKIREEEPRLITGTTNIDY